MSHSGARKVIFAALAGNSLIAITKLGDLIHSSVIVTEEDVERIYREQNEKIAFTALGFYILEGALLAASKMAAFSLLHLSQEFVSAGGPEYLLTLGNLSLESMTYVDDILLMLAFCVGGILFYYLLHKSRIVPPWLSLWGLITIIPLLIGTLAAFFNLEIKSFVLSKVISTS